jgi:hypothetical protein
MLRPLLWPLLLRLLPYLEKRKPPVASGYVLASELDTFQCDYEASDSDDCSYEEAISTESRKELREYGQYRREEERQKKEVEGMDLYKSCVKTL